MYFYFPSDVFNNYKKLHLQQALLEYVAINNGASYGWAEEILRFAQHADDTVLEKCNNYDIAKAGLYLISIELLKVEDGKLFITDAGIRCLQNQSYQSAIVAARGAFVSHINWILCTLISLSALVISILK